MAPISRLSTGVREGDNLNLSVAVAVDHEVRETSKRHAARTVLGSHSRYGSTQPRLATDQVRHSPDLRDEPGAEAGPAAFVPGHGSSEFLLCRRLNPPAASLFEKLRFNPTAYVFPVRGDRLPRIQHCAAPLRRGC